MSIKAITYFSPRRIKGKYQRNLSVKSRIYCTNNMLDIYSKTTTEILCFEIYKKKNKALPVAGRGDP
jgi:hypothetical protein